MGCIVINVAHELYLLNLCQLSFHPPREIVFNSGTEFPLHQQQVEPDLLQLVVTNLIVGIG